MNINQQQWYSEMNWSNAGNRYKFRFSLKLEQADKVPYNTRITISEWIPNILPADL